MKFKRIFSKGKRTVLDARMFESCKETTGPPYPVVMVVDNAPYHSNIEEVFSEEEFLGCEVLRLGPYSPMFNPIEQVWSLIKAYVKQELAAKI